MSKANRQRKADARAAEEARRLTFGKILRLVLKSLAFALLVALLLTALQALGLPVMAKGSFWLQLLVMLVVYIAAYPFLMSEFRVKRNKHSGR